MSSHQIYLYYPHYNTSLDIIPNLNSNENLKNDTLYDYDSFQNKEDKAWEGNQPGRNVAENLFIQFIYVKGYKGRKKVNRNIFYSQHHRKRNCRENRFKQREEI